MRIVFHHRIATRASQVVHMEELIAALEGLGNDVTVVGPSQVEELRFGESAASVASLKQRLPRWVFDVLALGYNMVAFWRLLRAVRRHRPDFVYERYDLFLLAGMWVHRLTGIPLILEVNAPKIEERSEYEGGVSLRRLASWSERAVWRSADALLPVSGVLAQHLFDAEVAPERITVAHNGIDPERFSPREEESPRRTQLGLDGRLVMGFTGFLRAWHGLDQVIAVLPSLAERFDAHLVVVGDGPVRAQLEAQAAELGVSDRLTVTGPVGRDEIASYIASFDIALQIGVTPYSSPMKLFEYMAMARPILAPSSANICEILTDDVDAVLFAPDDEAALVKAIERLAGDSDLRERLGRAALATVEEKRLTWTANAARVIEIAAGVAAQKAGVGSRRRRLRRSRTADR